MDNIKKLRIKDWRECVDILNEEWDLGKRKSNARGKICAWLYLFEILEESEIVITETYNNKLVGFCGYAKWNSSKHRFKKRMYSLIRKLLLYSPMIKNKKEIIKYNKNYDFTPKELENYFDGEISILILNNNFRGKGLGKKMLLKIFALAKNDNIKNLQILTDESSNFKIYEKCGCQRIYEKVIPYSEPDINGKICTEMGYIYEKVL